LNFWQNITSKLSPRDKRTARFGAICGGLILLYAFAAAPWLEDWAKTRRLLAAQRDKLKLIDSRGPAVTQEAAAVSSVPTLAMPAAEEIQGPLLRDKLNEQLKKAGIQIKSINFSPAVKSRTAAGMKLLRLQCRGTCSYDQVLNLLAHLDENPYMVGVEEIKLKCDTKKRSQMDLTLTVSTFCK